MTKMTNREKILLLILGIILVIGCFYQFVFIKQRKNIENLKVEETKLVDQYDDMKMKVAKIDDTNKNIKILNANIADKSDYLYPDIIQEKIIIEIDDMLEKSNVKGNLTFSEETENPVEVYFNKEEKDSNEKKGKTLEEMANDFNKKHSNEEIKEKLDDTKKLGEKNKDEDNEDEENQILVKQMKVTLNFNGSYKNINKFISLVRENSKIIGTPNIQLNNSGNEDNMSGTMDLEFYGVPRIDGEEKDFYLWDRTGYYGKDNPFKDFSNTINLGNVGRKDEKKNDFIMSVRSFNSDLPSFMLGKSNDLKNETYIYGDDNNKIEAEIVFSEEGGKYYAKYKTDKYNYPADYDNVGEVFQPGNFINVGVYSSSRDDITDKVTVNLKVINKTNKKVSIEIKNEDKINPRVNIIGEGKVEYVRK